MRSVRFDKNGAWRPALALVVLTLIWGYTWIAAKQALAYAPPFAFAAQRCVGGALALFIGLKLMRRSLRLAAPRETIAIGLVHVAAFLLLQTWALVEGGAGKTAVLIYTMPIWTLLLAWVFLGERIRGAQWVAALVTLAGLLLIVQPWDLHTSLLSRGLALAAAMSWAAGSVMIKRLRARVEVDLVALTAWQIALGAVPLVGVAAFVPEPATQWSIPYVAILAFISIVSTALCWGLWVYILDRVPAWEASLSVLGTPVVAILSSRLLLAEEFARGEIAGIVLIGAGLALLSLLGWQAARSAGDDETGPAPRQ